MAQVTEILLRIEDGDPSAAEQLLPIVYDALRKLAAARLEREQPGQTLQPTALVHEVYLRLVDVEHQQKWESRGHFFAAAAEAMRRILVDNARRKASQKRGGGMQRMDWEPVAADPMHALDDLLALDEALETLATLDSRKAELVKLRYFSGLTNEQAAEVLGVSLATVERDWSFARAWLRREIMGEAPAGS